MGLKSFSSDERSPPPLPKQPVGKGSRGIEGVAIANIFLSSRSWVVLNRQEVWSDERKDDSLKVPITFQPEDTGYCVASIMFVFCMIEVITMSHTYTDGHLIYSDSDNSTCEDIG